MSQFSPPHLPTSGQPEETGRPPSEAPAGSLLKGFLLAWLILFFGEPGTLGLVESIGVGVVAIPPLAVLVAGIVLKVRDRSRTGTGLLLGLLSFVAVTILLVAACFGLFFNAKMGNMH
jgi:hypothetical protein